MEDSGEAPESDYTGDFAGKLNGLLAISDDDGDEFLPQFPIKEEMVEEVMQELWNEINPSSSSPSQFVVVDGNNESCGPSFSDSASTVMAGIEMGGVRVSCYVGSTEKFTGGKMDSPATGNSSWVLEKDRECYIPGVGEVLGQKMDGCDGGEFDDEWLTRVFSWGPLELDEWT